MENIVPFLMFEGKAEQAITFYTSLFPNSKIENITRYGPDQAGQEGTVMLAHLSVGGQEIMCLDSAVHHEFTFTPSMSFYVNCTNEPEIDRLFDQLSRGGQVLMPLDRYPFADRFAWVADQFGVSWQLNLGRKAE